ncbi:fatty acyl-AMP ligase [Nocardia sp. NPDC020380]|uniref:fatty acyl-AMP ligase n=1 Tax=Nocardia sp. NPDC020380 TaxID=3364309 RepID=UPI00379E3128
MQRSKIGPATVVYEFLGRDGSIADQFTYRDLESESARIASELVAVTDPHEPVILLFSDNKSFICPFLACLRTGRIGVPVHMPSRRRIDGLAGIVADSGARIVVSTAAVQAGMAEEFAKSEVLRDLRWLLAEQAVRTAGELPDRVSPDDIAFLQYTSGSTGSPKGVEVRHRNLLHNIEQIRRAADHHSGRRGVTWLPYFHDMGLIAGLLQPLYVGFPVTVMEPLAFVRDPLLWLRAIAAAGAAGAVSSGAPNFAFDLCVQRVSRQDAATLDLGNWRVAFVGAEPINPQVLARFAEHFAVSGFRPETFFPCYGLAEATLFVAGGPVGAGIRSRPTPAPGRPAAAGDALHEVINCGPWIDTDVLVVDPLTGTRCADGEVGEIWLAGPSIPAGYWRRPQDTEDCFRARLASSSATDRKYLRTGDLGFVADSELYITGRLKDLIIVNGRNVYPQDIERTVEDGLPAVRSNGCAAFAVPSGSEERIVVMAELDPRGGRAEPGAVEDAVKVLVAREHQVTVSQVVCLRPGKLPRTTSGKLQRRQARADFLAQFDTPGDQS